MHDLLISGFLFAQEQKPATPPNPLFQFVFMGLVIAVMFYIVLIRPNQKRERDRKSMLGALKKDDRVVTIGGIKGIVANVNLEEDEVVLKVDESSGAKLRVVLSSVARVITPEDQAQPAKKES